MLNHRWRLWTGILAPLLLGDSVLAGQGPYGPLEVFLRVDSIALTEGYTFNASGTTQLFLATGVTGFVLLFLSAMPST